MNSKIVLILSSVLATIAVESVRVLICANQTDADNQARIEGILRMNGYEIETLIKPDFGETGWIRKCLGEDKGKRPDEFVLLVRGFNFLVQSGRQQLLQSLDKLFPITIPSLDCSENETCPVRNANELPLALIGKRGVLKKVFSSTGKNELDCVRDALENKQISFDEQNAIFRLMERPLETIPKSPIILSRNDKVVLNQISNYLPSVGLCSKCHAQLDLDTQNLPSLAIGVFIEKPTPFFEVFLEKLIRIDYPKHKIDLFVHNAVDYHNETVELFIRKHGSAFKSLKYLPSQDDILETEAKNAAIKAAKELDIQFYVQMDSTAHVEDDYILKDLISWNKSVIAPMMTRSGSLWANFWGDVDLYGFYLRSADYMDILNNRTSGLWNVPFVSELIIIRKDVLMATEPISPNIDFDLAITAQFRSKGIHMFVLNSKTYGQLIDPSDFNTTLSRPNLYEYRLNKAIWVDEYVDKDFFVQLNSSRVPQPTPDVFWFPIFTRKFCEDLLSTVVESPELWSGGKHDDQRIAGGYENVPTDDIHFTQLRFDQIWHSILVDLVRPMQLKLFEGHDNPNPRAPLSFVVRYHKDKQDRLRPHHDASTYTLNIALNRPNIDYEGGGVKFLRYNTVIKDLKMGWALMHPGRLTHMHEGLPTTNGTRYILVSFVDP